MVHPPPESSYTTSDSFLASAPHRILPWSRLRLLTGPQSLKSPSLMSPNAQIDMRPNDLHANVSEVEPTLYPVHRSPLTPCDGSPSDNGRRKSWHLKSSLLNSPTRSLTKSNGEVLDPDGQNPSHEPRKVTFKARMQPRPRVRANGQINPETQVGVSPQAYLRVDLPRSLFLLLRGPESDSEQYGIGYRRPCLTFSDPELLHLRRRRRRQRLLQATPKRPLRRRRR